MNNKSIHDLDHQLVKAHFQTPEQSPLPRSKQEILDRAMAGAKILTKNPVRKNAAALLRALYPGISRATSYRDLTLADSLFHSVHTFDFDAWNTFLLNDIVETMQKCRKINTVASLEAIVMEHANLLKVIGKRPEKQPDPNRNEPHRYYLMMQDIDPKVKVDMQALADLPVTGTKELIKMYNRLRKQRKKLEKK